MVLYIGSVGCMILGVVYICSALYDCLGGVHILEYGGRGNVVSR